MTTPHDPFRKADPGAPSQPASVPDPAAAAAAGQAGAGDAGQWYQDPSGQWWYQDPTGQWYQDPRYADPAAEQQQQAAGYGQAPQYQYPAPDQGQWAAQQPAVDPGAYNPYGYGQQTPAGYPSYPGYSPYPTGYGAPAQTGRRPGVVVASAVMWIISGVLSAIVGIVISIYGGTASDGDLIEDFDLGVEDFDEIDTIRAILVTIGVVAAVVGVALVIFGVLLLKRKGWARILTTIGGVLCVLPLVVTLVGPIVVIVAIVLQFLPAANDWFRTRSAAP